MKEPFMGEYGWVPNTFFIYYFNLIFPFQLPGTMHHFDNHILDHDWRCNLCGVSMDIAFHPHERSRFGDPHICFSGFYNWEPDISLIHEWFVVVY